MVMTGRVLQRQSRVTKHMDSVALGYIRRGSNMLADDLVAGWSFGQDGGFHLQEERIALEVP